MIKIRAGQNIQGDNKFLSIESKLSIGFAAQSASEPVIEKTNKIISSWKLELMPHFSLNFFILQR